MRATRLVLVLAAAFFFVGQANALPITVDSVHSDLSVPAFSISDDASLEALIASLEESPASSLPYTSLSLMALGAVAVVSLGYHRSRRQQWRRIQHEINGRF